MAGRRLLGERDLEVREKDLCQVVRQILIEIDNIIVIQ